MWHEWGGIGVNRTLNTVFILEIDKCNYVIYYID